MTIVIFITIMIITIIIIIICQIRNQQCFLFCKNWEARVTCSKDIGVQWNSIQFQPSPAVYLCIILLYYEPYNHPESLANVVIQSWENSKTHLCVYNFLMKWKRTFQFNTKFLYHIHVVKWFTDFDCGTCMQWVDKPYGQSVCIQLYNHSFEVCYGPPKMLSIYTFSFEVHMLCY